jgi:hypothetical protein
LSDDACLPGVGVIDLGGQQCIPLRVGVAAGVGVLGHPRQQYVGVAPGPLWGLGGHQPLLCYCLARQGQLAGPV